MGVRLVPAWMIVAARHVSIMVVIVIGQIIVIPVQMIVLRSGRRRSGRVRVSVRVTRTRRRHVRRTPGGSVIVSVRRRTAGGVRVPGISRRHVRCTGRSSAVVVCIRCRTPRGVSVAWRVSARLRDSTCHVLPCSVRVRLVPARMIVTTGHMSIVVVIVVGQIIVIPV